MRVCIFPCLCVCTCAKCTLKVWNIHGCRKVCVLWHLHLWFPSSSSFICFIYVAWRIRLRVSDMTQTNALADEQWRLDSFICHTSHSCVTGPIQTCKYDMYRNTHYGRRASVIWHVYMPTCVWDTPHSRPSARSAFICAVWHGSIYALTCACMWHDSSICDTTYWCATRLIRMWHDSLIWLIYMWHDLFTGSGRWATRAKSNCDIHGMPRLWMEAIVNGACRVCRSHVIHDLCHFTYEWVMSSMNELSHMYMTHVA